MEQSKEQSIVKMLKPECELLGHDGNVFNVIGRVVRALEKNGLKQEAVEFRQKALKSTSYDEVIKLCFDYVDVC